MKNNDLTESFELETVSDSPVSAVARTRVSEGSEDEIKNSIQSQKDEIRKLAQRLNVGKIYWFTELEAVSAFKLGGDTELFKQARAFACSNKDVKYFLQWDQTRFSRDRHSSQNFKRELLKCGVDVRFCHGDIADKSTGSAVILEAVQEALAEADGIEKGQHVLRGCLANAKNRDPETGYCFKNGGSPPYGYKRHRVEWGKKKNGDPLLKTVWLENNEVVNGHVDGKLVSKTVADWVRHILIVLRLKEGMGFDKIRDHLNKIGLHAPRGQYWSDTTLCEMTRNIAYIGRSIYNKHNYSSYRRSMGIKIKDDSELIIQDDAHPALITEEQFQLLQQMAKPTNSSVRSARKQLCDSPYILSFNFICKSCGGNVKGNNHRYSCGTYHRKGKEACGASAYSFDQQWLENEVITRLGLTLDEKRIQGIIENRLKQYHVGSSLKDINALREKIKEDTKSRDSLMNILKTNPPQGKSLEFIITQIEGLTNSIESCEVELKEITKPVVILSKKELEEEIRSVGELFAKSNYEQKRAILKELIKEIVLDPVNRCVALYRYSVPQSTSVVNNKKAQTGAWASNSSDFRSTQHGCGGWI